MVPDPSNIRTRTLQFRTNSTPEFWYKGGLAEHRGGVCLTVRERRHRDALERWVSEIIQGVLKNAKDVAAAAAKAFGDDKVKSD